MGGDLLNNFFDIHFQLSSPCVILHGSYVSRNTKVIHICLYVGFKVPISSASNAKKSPWCKNGNFCCAMGVFTWQACVNFFSVYDNFDYRKVLFVVSCF